MYVKLTAVPAGGRLEMLLPLSDGRQHIVSRTLNGIGFAFREEADGSNLRGVWVRSSPADEGEIRYAVTAEVRSGALEVLEEGGAGRKPPTAADLGASPLIQSDDPEIRRRARELTAGERERDAIAWALFQFVATAIQTASGQVPADARGVLLEGRGNTTGKARLLAGLLRSVGIAARIVGGLQLEDATKKRGTISWVEARLGERWVPMDPGGNHYGWLPHDYLALYRGDLPLIVHTVGMGVEYGFIVRQITREVALGLERDAPGAERPHIEPRVGADRVHTVTSYQEKPVASALLLVDQRVPESVAERILKEAREDEVNLVLMQSRFQSRYFREQHLQRLVSNNLSLVSRAHLVVIATGDDAGLYALFALGERDVPLEEARILISGSFSRPVGRVLGAVLVRLLGAGEVVLVSRPVPVLALWETARANLLRGVPMAEEARKWGFDVFSVTPAGARELGWWRAAVVGAWTRAVRAQVPLQALNLILVLPLIATVIVVARIVIGIDSFGTFAPVIVSLAFLTTGLEWGVIIFCTIVSCGAAVRMLLRRIRLQLVSRLAILVATVAGLMAGLTVLGATFGIGALINVSIFPMVIMSSVIENFAASQFEFGTREAARLTFNTLLLACLCYAAIERTGLQSLLLAFPELILVSVALNVVLGKWRGLRALEYLRFFDFVRSGSLP